MDGYYFMAGIVGFGGNFAPRSWAYCGGQLLAISQNSALFSLLGTTYGGDGRTSFGLPDLRGRIPVSAGTGPGLSTYRLGQRSGVERVYLNVLQMPSHNHAVNQGYAATAGVTDPTNAYPANISQPVWGSTKTGNMQQATCGLTGGSQYHENRMPWEAINWVICMFGTYPSRN